MLLRRFGVCALFSLLFLAEYAGAANRPNVIAIVTDDQGRWAMRAYGNTDARTPHMDRIAAEGALFTNAFVATPVCSPSRATYMTGRYPTEVKITDFIAPQEAEAGIGLDPNTLTWPEVLRRNGYRTALVGKWHLGMLPQFHPTRLGFDYFYGFTGGGNSPMNPTLEVDGREQRLKGPLPDLLTTAAIRFVRENRDRPFALCLHFRAPHTPYMPVPEEDYAPFKDIDPQIPDLPGLDVPQTKQRHREYYASIHSIDRNLGRLLAALDELDLADNTLVLFTSDHGYNEGRHYVSTKGNGHWVGGGNLPGAPKRPNMWDTSVMVPLAVRWPAVVRGGTVIDDLVSNVDMFRTVLGALELPVPEAAGAHGIDYSPLLRGETLPPRDAIYGQYDLHNSGLAYMRMLRTERYKYVKHFKANFMDELYDLQADPGETNNLLRRNARRSDVAEQLHQQLLGWMRSIDDPLLRDE